MIPALIREGDRLRALRPADERFVVDSWVESYAESAVAASMRRSTYEARWRRLVASLLRVGETTVLCDGADDSVVLGWMCREGPTLHYLYVREDFRRHGRADALVGERSGLRRYTHRTPLWQRCGEAVAGDLTYDPARAWRHFGVLD